MLDQTGGARTLLLGVAVLQLVALGTAVPQPLLSTRSGPRALLLDAGGGPAVQAGRLSGAAAGGAADDGAAGALRRLQKQPLPNFEIGVPGPNKKRLG